MSNKEGPGRLWSFRIDHMIQACEEIMEFTKGIEQEEFYEDMKTFRSVERCFQILGDAARHVPQEQKDRMTSIPWREINGMRNVVVHEYEAIAENVLWTTAKNKIPALLKDLKESKNKLEKE